MNKIDPVHHPAHYNSHPSGVECIQIAECYGFCIGNAIKYLWRAGLKGDAVEDLEKARWYLDREIQRRRATADRTPQTSACPLPLAPAWQSSAGHTHAPG